MTVIIKRLFYPPPSRRDGWAIDLLIYSVRHILWPSVHPQPPAKVRRLVPRPGLPPPSLSLGGVISIL